MAPTVSYDSGFCVSVKHDFSETFDREKPDGKTVGKGEFNYFVTRLCKLQSCKFLDLLIYFQLFYTYGKAKDQPRLNGSSNKAFIRREQFEANFYLVKLVDAIFPVYKQKKGRR